MPITYSAYISLTSGSYGAPVATGLTSLSYQYTGLDPETEYFMVVTATDPGFTPDPPRMLSVDVITSNTIDVTWLSPVINVQSTTHKHTVTQPSLIGQSIPQDTTHTRPGLTGKSDPLSTTHKHTVSQPSILLGLEPLNTTHGHRVTQPEIKLDIEVQSTTHRHTVTRPRVGVADMGADEIDFRVVGYNSRTLFTYGGM